MTDPVPAPTGRRLYLYTAHQDDETLWSGQILAHHTLVGREVHIILGTDGSTSGVRDTLNGTTSSSWWGGYHYPAREGIPAPLTPADFAAARDRELIQASRQLGVTPDRVHLRTSTRTTALTLDAARALILEHEALTPGAGHYTTHWTDPHPDHAALGTALRNLALEGAVTDARWVVRRSQIGTMSSAVEYVVPSAYAAQAKHMAQAAVRSYSAWAPPEAYAIGPQSVPSDFDWAASGASNWIVRTP